MKRIGVDVGGTFTDLLFVDQESGEVRVEKVASTPDDPSDAVIEGLQELCVAAAAGLDQIDGLVHGTTVATNIALTGAGATVGLITTEGFRDLLHIARHKKPFNFSLQQDLPWQARPLVKRRHRLTVRERIGADGEILVPLDEEEVRERVLQLKEAGVTAIAICLLHSYLNPEHERRIADIVRDVFPEAYVSASHEVVPLYREFERFSTTALNAFVGPKVSNYLRRLDRTLKDQGLRTGMNLLQSSGGMGTVEAVSERPVNLLMSGPVGGVLGGIWAARMSGFESVVTLDIGGTSADIGVAAGGELRMRHLLDTRLGDHQAMIPMVDIDTIGAGGGSLAYVDEGGAFRVGPESAGADPGPAAYGRGGLEPTSTDAQVVLGRLRPDRGLVGGEMELDEAAARNAFESLAGDLELSVPEAALGALQVQKFGMTQAIELSSVRRGYDPSDFTFVAAGGAGPLFACDIALELEIPRVLIPPHPGIIAAAGLLTTDLRHEVAATERHALDEIDVERLRERFDELTEEAVRRLDADEVAQEDRLLLRMVDCRYAGQGYEVRFAAPGGEIDSDWVNAAKVAFHAAHETEYGHRFDAPIDLINIRVIGIGSMEDLKWPELEAGNGSLDAAMITERDVTFEVKGEAVVRKTAFYDRSLLRSGDVFTGPAVIEQYDTTTVVPPGLIIEVDEVGNLIIDCTAKEAEPSGEELAEPIMMRVMGGALSSIAKEMAGVLYRMAYSPLIRESEDLGAGLFDRHGNNLAESDSTPMFMGAMPKIVKGIISILGDDIDEGDVIMHNDPYLGATHSPDVAMVVPIFHDGELIAFAGASAHLLDIGGAYPGIAIDHVDNWAEGSIFRALKIARKGVWQTDLWEHILSNTRTPTENRGDMQAMVAACRLAQNRVGELIDRYGPNTVLEAGDYWIDYSERILRREIAKVPDGVYEADTGWLDDDGVHRNVQLPIKVKVIVEGDDVTIDLTGSSEQVETGFNCPFEGTTVSALTFAIRMIFLDEVAFPTYVPQNEGLLKPVHVVAPEGTIFNPKFPRACFARFCQAQRAVDLVIRALAPILPKQVTAGNAAYLGLFSYSGFNQDEEEYWVYLEVNEGSYGGRPAADGMDSVDCLLGNTRNTPIEELEWRYPIRTERYELREDGAAAGKWRGGIGIVRVNRFLTETIVSAEGERHEGDLPWGAFGGHEGDLASLTHNEGRDDQSSWPSKLNGAKVAADDTLTVRAPNSGGYGNPLDRDPQLVLEDLLDGFILEEKVDSDYGVVLNGDRMSVDVPATRQLRAERRDKLAAQASK